VSTVLKLSAQVPATAAVPESSRTKTKATKFLVIASSSLITLFYRHDVVAHCGQRSCRRFSAASQRGPSFEA
jgi:hypothetical protein